VALISCNHDTIRPRFNLSYRELALYYGFLFTMPGTPFLYYGDEIGMRSLKLPTREGGYFRTGSRTPMQWSRGANLGFSTARAEDLYLPVDTAPGAPTVEEQEKDGASLLNTVKALLRLRHDETDLQAKPNLEIVYAEKEKLPFVYKRGGLVVGVNPSGKATQVSITIHEKPVNGSAVYTIGTGSLEQGMCELGPQSFAVWRV
jgi:maltose alpha-D-glucosyltransferase/alpha-amylase